MSCVLFLKTEDTVFGTTPHAEPLMPCERRVNLDHTRPTLGGRAYQGRLLSLGLLPDEIPYPLCYNPLTKYHLYIKINCLF